MPLEIERKFLVYETGEDFSTDSLVAIFPSIRELRDVVLRTGVKMRQGYLPVEAGEELSRVVGLESAFQPEEARLRDAGGRYFLTLKTDGDLTRGETPDREISKTVFDLYWPYAKRRIEKVRLKRNYGNNIAEIDVFTDRDLILAEVEVADEATALAVNPLGKDVTSDKNFKNKNLAKSDFHRKFVVTGGPCTGKSSTIDYIACMQYPTVHETARQIIDEQLRMGGQIVPWERFLEFQLEVLHASLIAEQSLSNQGTVFLDRGIPDAVAYCVGAGIDPPLPLRDAVMNQHYRAIFVLDTLPYKKDDARREGSEEAARIHSNLIKLYSRLGHNVISVPVNTSLPLEESVKERAHFVVSKSHGLN